MSNSATEATKRKVYDHFPPAAVFIAVHDGDPSAGSLLKEEITAFAKARPTAYLVGYYRGRIETWIFLSGLEGCLKLISASAGDGPVPDHYVADFE